MTRATAHTNASPLLRCTRPKAPVSVRSPTPETRAARGSSYRREPSAGIWSRSSGRGGGGRRGVTFRDALRWRWFGLSDVSLTLTASHRIRVTRRRYGDKLPAASSPTRRSSCCPASQRPGIARKAFERVTKRVLPVSHVRLQRALAAEARSYSEKVAVLETRSRGLRTSEADGDGDQRGANVAPDHDGD